MNIKLIEFGISFAILAIFIVLFAMAEDIAGTAANIAYIGIIAAFATIICLFGMKMAPYLYE